jgi:hypothetical protein
MAETLQLIDMDYQILLARKQWRSSVAIHSKENPLGALPSINFYGLSADLGFRIKHVYIPLGRSQEKQPHVLEGMGKTQL